MPKNGKFSQGGVMACELGLKSQYSIKAVVGLSCYLSFGWEKIFQPKQKETMPNFFLGHGSEDPIVPIVVGKQARDDLQEKNISVVWKKYEAVPHTVCKSSSRLVLLFSFGWEKIFQKAKRNY